MPPEAFGLIGTGISSLLNYASQAKTNALNKQMAEDAYRKQEEAIRRMNEYNSPSMQVARMKAAGLSPNLAYGANGETVGQQSEIPAYQPIPSESPRVSDFGSAFTDAARLGLEMREQTNRDNLAIVEAKLKDAKAFEAIKLGELSMEQQNVLARSLQPNLDKIAAETSEIWSRKAVNNSTVRVNESVIHNNRAQATAARAAAGCSDAMTDKIITLLPHVTRNMDADSMLKYWLSEQGAANSAHILQTLTTDKEYLKLAWNHYNIDLEKLGIDYDYLGISKEELDLHKKQFEHMKAIDWAEFSEQTVMDISNAALGWASFGLSTMGKPSPNVIKPFTGGKRVLHGVHQ